MSEKISFDEAFAQSSSEAIKILGDVVAKIVTDYLESRYSINITKTANNPAALGEALEHAIDGGRTIVERKLMNLLYEKLAINPILKTNNNLSSFEQRVNEVRRIYLSE
ncbi:MAG TPA: hypothetical protein VFG90_04950 [Nitrososphaeraceae archaeon]|nr:hypothetical protein [Nitrososphaeraceae archaeon]